MQVQAGQKVTLLYAVQQDKLHFRHGPSATAIAHCVLMLHRCSLREGDGDWVEKPPWTVTWGGGASIESPHFQRVHYCELLVRLQPHRAIVSRLTSVGCAGERVPYARPVQAFSPNREGYENGVGALRKLVLGPCRAGRHVP